MHVIKLKNIIFISLVILIFIICLINFKNNKINTSSKSFEKIIVVDAGHGNPDGGAESIDIVEASINLEIATLLQKELENIGFDVIMTREDENTIVDQDKKSIANIKKEDLNKRVEIINNSGADFAISIHLNKYPDSKYYGWQCFYNKSSEDSKKLAISIQEAIKNTTKRENKRQALKISGIKIIDKTTIPVVIVECGFISNKEEATLLTTKSYQEKIVSGIVQGILNFYE